MASIAQVTVRFGVDLKDFTTKMQKATKEMRALGKTMQNTGRDLTRNISLPILAAGGAATKLAFDFDESMTKIQTLVGISSDVVNSFKKDVLELAGRTAQAPADLADALFTVTSAGLRGAEAMQVLEMAAKGSAVGMGETGEIAKAVTAVMQAYGPENMSAAKAMDIFTATIRAGNLAAADLAPVLGRVVGISAQLGVGFDQVGASIATFTRLGVDSSEAVTGLTGFLNAMIKPSKEGEKALATMGLTFSDLREEIKEKGLASVMIGLIKSFDGNVEALGDVIPNVRALATVMGTAGVQGDAYLKIQDEIANSTGILNKAFEDTSQGGAFKLKAVFNDLKQIGTDLGLIILPIVAQLGERLRGLFAAFKNLTDATKENIIKYALLAAAIGPVIFIVGTMITSFGTLLATLKTVSIFLAANPWFALAGAVAAVVAALVSYSAISRTVEQSSQSASQKVKEEKEELNLLVRAITSLNEDNETRAGLLDDLKTKYPDFIKNIGTEELTNKNLSIALQEVNKEYIKKIALAAGEDDIKANLQEQKKLQDDLKNQQIDLIKLKDELYKADSLTWQEDVARQIDTLNFSIDGGTKRIVTLREELIATQKAYQDLAGAAFGGTPAVVPATGGGGGAGTGGGNPPRQEVDPIGPMQERLALVQKERGEVEGLTDDYLNSFVVMAEGPTVLEQAFGQFTGSVANMFEDMLTGAKVSINGIIQMLIRLAARLAAAAVMAAILSTLLGGGANVAGAAKTGYSFLTLFKNFAGFREKGGPVMGGSTYIVGEKGPELFSPGASGMITPNHMLGGSGGNPSKVQIEFVGSIPLRWDGRDISGIINQNNIRIKKMGG